MNGRLIVVLTLAVPFLALSAVAIVQHGYLGIFEVALRDTASAQVFADLCMALLIVTGWLRQDAMRRGLAWWPWVVATLPLGSIAPLGYLVYREVRGRRPAAAA